MNAPTRLLRLAMLLYCGVEISSAKIRRIYKVSRATSKRDMRLLEQNLPTERRGDAIVIRP